MIRVESVVNKWNGEDLGSDSTFSGFLSAGDISTHELIVHESIMHQTAGLVPGNTSEPLFVLMPPQLFAEKKLQFPSFKSLNGFYVGQNVTIIKYNPDSSTDELNTTIVAIDQINLTIQFEDLFSPDSENVPIYGVNLNSSVQHNLRIFSTDLRTNFFFNLSFNIRPYPWIWNNLSSTTAGGFIQDVGENRKSPVDNTKLRFWAGQNTADMEVDDEIDCQQIGYKSGSGITLVKLKRLVDIDDFTRQWKITIEMINPIHLLESLNQDVQPFFDERLVFYSDIEWYSGPNIIQVPSITDQPTVVQHDIFAITFFDDPWGLPNQLIEPVDGDIWYNEESEEKTIRVSTRSPVDQVQFGCAYIPTDPAYFKQKYVSQDILSMLIATQNITEGVIYLSTENELGAQYQIEITEYTVTLNASIYLHEIKFKFKPVNQEFEDFIELRGDGDRLFYFWVKAAQTCHLMFKKQLIKKPKDEVLLDVYKGFASDWCKIQLDKTTEGYTIDNSYQFDNIFPVKPVFSTEDNFLLLMDLALPLGIRYEKLVFQIVLQDSLEEDVFSPFETYNIDLSNNPYDSTTGETVWTEQLGNTFNIGNQNFDRLLVRSNPLIPPLGVQGVRITAPVLVNWRYWLTQITLFQFLMPAGLNTKDWQAYVNSSLPEQFRFFLKITLESETFIAKHYTPIYDLLQYDEEFTNDDEEWQGEREITYKITSSGETVPNLIVGQLMTVEVKFTTGIELDDFFGMITIEEKETNIRWALSSNYNFNGNLDNPLRPSSGQTKVKITTSGTNEVTYSCDIDCSLLGGNNYKITAQHWNKNVKIEKVRSKFDTTLSFFPSPAIVNGEDVLQKDCCEFFDVFARLDSTSSEFNDITLILGKVYFGYEDYSFKLYDNEGNFLLNIPVLDSVNNDTDKYAMVEWRQILDDFGAGCYEIKIEFTYGENNMSFSYGKYSLKIWNLDDVLQTVKMESTFNSKISYNKATPNPNNLVELDFRNMFLVDSIRFKGFFGKRDPKPVVNNIILWYRTKVKSHREFLNEYELKTNPITNYIGNRIMDLHLLNENAVSLWDYNSYNHDFYSAKQLIINEIPKPNYKELSNKTEYFAIFGDKELKQKSGY